MRQPSINIDDLIRVAQTGATAVVVKEELGLPHDVSWIQKLMKRHLGPRPTRTSVERPNPIREALTTHMESNGLDRRYCSVGHHQARATAIHALGPTLDELVFVCTERCAAPGDF